MGFLQGHLGPLFIAIQLLLLHRASTSSPEEPFFFLHSDMAHTSAGRCAQLYKDRGGGQDAKLKIYTGSPQENKAFQESLSHEQEIRACVSVRNSSNADQILKPFLMYEGVMLNGTLRDIPDVNGGWSKWVDQPCSATCGASFKERTRCCDSPPRLGNGHDCEGEDVEKIACNDLPPCPVPLFDCEEVMEHYKKECKTFLPGVYKLGPFQNGTIWKDAHCDVCGWTYIQSRGQFGNDINYFYKEYKLYKMGFGEPGKEHWLGLETMYEMTNTYDYQLRIDLEAVDGIKNTGIWSSFKLDDKNLYRLNVSGYQGGLGESGASSLDFGQGQAFSTYDHDVDTLKSGNCAVVDGGAWWFEDCFRVHLNGRNYNTKSSTVWQGIIFNPFHSNTHSLRSTVMAIKRRRNNSQC